MGECSCRDKVMADGAIEIITLKQENVTFREVKL